MKTRLLITIVITAILLGGFTFWSYIQYAHYETWGNNEHWYFHPDGYGVECEIRLYQSPSPCNAVDEHGNIVDTKTELGNWKGVIWLENPDFCKDQGGVWNNTAKGCYGLYEMCEKDGGIPRFLKKSLPFPDIEENKPVSYLMDCYEGYMMEYDYFDEPVFTDTALLNNNNPKLVKQILEYCNSTGVKLSYGISSSNGTHIITNNTCEWQTIKKYESDRELNFVSSICEHVTRPIEDEPTSWSNGTHYIDGNDCEWQDRR